MTAPPAAVVIGRNEGDRLTRCLASLGDRTDPVVYVDSGSTDESLSTAHEAGARVIELDLSTPFTAARARNAGLAALAETRQEGTRHSCPALVQFIDGDCEMQPGWLEAAQTHLKAHPMAAIVCGRLRERFPNASVYNRLCDTEWDTPVGRTLACGGIFLARRAALDAVEGFNPALIAGEEPELCVRLRAAGWEIWRIDTEMALHDAAMTRFGQWWTRARRAGHAAAEGMAMHGRPPERHGVASVRRALAWGLALPLAILAGFLLNPWALLGLLIYPVQITRLALRDGGSRFDWIRAFFLTLGKFPEMLGIFGYWTSRFSGRRRGLIEYK